MAEMRDDFEVTGLYGHPGAAILFFHPGSFSRATDFIGELFSRNLPEKRAPSRMDSRADNISR